MKLVVDTSILIDHLRKGPRWRQVITETKEVKNIKLFLPTIVIFELFSGSSSRNASDIKIIQNLIKNFKRTELTEEIAKRAGELYRDVSKRLDIPDYIISASALEIGGTVLTLNKKHFKQIPNLPIYPL